MKSDARSSLIFVSNNRAKLAEYRELLNAPDLRMLNLSLEDLQHHNIEEFARRKIKQVIDSGIPGPFFVEHTGLVIKAWGELPGGLTGQFVKHFGCNGICLMLAAYPNEDRLATATTVIGYFDGKAAQIFSGQAPGRVPSSPRGSQGFGWDPIFVPARNEKTYAEMTGPEKNQVSMRRRAATTFVDYLDLNPIDIPTPAPDEEGSVQRSSPIRLKPLKRHVFISYCHDNQTEVRELCRYLRDAGETVWWDQDIPPGQDLGLAIGNALRVSYAVIVCLSTQNTVRHRSGIYPEIQDALRIYREYPPDSIFIVPVRLSPCELPAIEIDGTRMFDRLAVADLFPAERRNAGLDKLVRALRLAPEYPARGGV